MQIERIINKAKKLGIEVNTNDDINDNLRTIASQVGFNDVNDLDGLESVLDEQINYNSQVVSPQSEEDVDRNPRTKSDKFGEKEYNQAKNKDGVYDSNYYRDRQEKLNKKTEHFNEERKKTEKKTSDGTATKPKSKMNRVLDQINYANARKNEIANKVDSTKAEVYNKLHPGEALKNKAKSKINKKTNEIKKNIKDKAKVITKAAKKKIVAFIAANPWIIPIIIFLIFLFIIISSIISTNSDNGYYAQECDFNSAPVHLNVCDTSDEKNLDLKSYVLGTTAGVVGDTKFSDEALKAIMIIVKTNALSIGNYNNQIKDVYLDTCTYQYNENYPEEYESLFKEIENYLYLSSIYKDEITNLSLSNSLMLNEDKLTQIKEYENNSYNSILSLLYDNLGGDIQHVYSGTLFLGDNQLYRMTQYGIVSKKKSIYSEGYGYDWLIGNGSFDSSLTNSTSGGINGINEKMIDGTNYNIIIWMGLNDANLDNAQNYFNKYYELATGEWSNNNITVISLGPVEAINSLVSNTSINYFNETMEGLINGAGLTNLKFVRINYEISEYKEGIYYSNSDYKKIYKSMLSNIDTASSVSHNYKIYSLADHCEFIYTEQSSTSSVCEAMSINSTSLSKDEFINKVNNYYADKTSSAASVFKSNADLIYDLATSNGINPELVVVRAHLEGYSPSSKGYPSYNNYWGIACYNGQSLSNCASYSSFSEGVLGFINTIKKYDSLSSMMAKYAYIGRYWFNPGDAGTGGCYYYPYINKYMSYARSGVVSSACATEKTCSGASCIATTDEDQLAYSMWQVEKMANQRNTMFDMSDDLCETSSQGCTYYAQGDSRWKSKHLGSSRLTMGNSGCAVTSLAMGITCSGTETTIPDFDAGKFLDALNAGECFTDKGAINWSCSAISKVAPSVSLIDTVSLKDGTTDSYKMGIINGYNVNNHIVLVHFVNSEHKRGHYIAVTSTNGSNITGKDPSGGKVSTINVSYVDQVVAYKTS